MDYLTGLGMDKIHEYEQELTEYTVDTLSRIKGLKIFGHAPERGGAISFDVEGIHPHDLSQFTDQEGIAIRAGHHCAQPLIRSSAFARRGRASLYLYNEPRDVDALIDGIVAAKRVLKRSGAR